MDNCTQWWLIVVIGCMWVLKEFVNYVKYHARIDEIQRKSDEVVRKHKAEEIRKREQRQNQNQSGN